MNRRHVNESGFTLVELLIVVAIIGVLATMGVPAYKRMVERAKTKEAQVALGGLYTAELAFQSEYGGYGNNLAGVGFEFEGSNAIYTVGFPSSNACGSGVPSPAVGTGVGDQINNSYGQYFTGSRCSVAGRGVVPPGAAAACAGGAGVSCLFNASMFDAANGTYFVATATGCISSGCNPNTPSVGTFATLQTAADAQPGDFTASAPAADANRRDSWAINQRRKLVRMQAGGSGA